MHLQIEPTGRQCGPQTVARANLGAVRDGVPLRIHQPRIPPLQDQCRVEQFELGLQMGQAHPPPLDPAMALLGQQLPQAVESSAEKLLLALHTSAPIILVNSAAEWPAVLASAAPVRTESVPVPPPRA